MDAKTLIEKKQERAKLTADMRAVMDKHENADMPAEEVSKIENMEAEWDKLDTLITREEKQLNRERSLGETEEEDTSFQSSDLRNAFSEYLTSGSVKAYDEYNTLQMANPTQAGYLVAPEKFQMQLIQEIADATFMRQKAKVLPPLKGAQSLGYPVKVDGMSSFGWGTETSAPNPDSSLKFGKREFKPIPGTSEILVSKTLIRNVQNADGLIRGEIKEELAGAYENAYMNGTGANQPLGLFVASNDGIPTSRDVSTGNTATAMTFDGLIEAQEKVKSQYQKNCEWIFHRDGVKQLRKIKDGNDQYIWQPSVALGQPDLLLNKPVNRSEYAPNTFTASKYVGLYGDLKHYWIVDALTMEIQVLFELYARNHLVDYMTRIETDGAPVLSAAFARVKLASS